RDRVQELTAEIAETAEQDASLRAPRTVRLISSTMNRVRVWLIVFACWTLLALLFASQTLLYYAYAGNKVSSWQVIGPALADWYLWAALTPAIAWLARRYPIVSRRWGRALLVHIPVSIAFAVLKLGVRVLLGHAAPLLATMT